MMDKNSVNSQSVLTNSLCSCGQMFFDRRNIIGSGTEFDDVWLTSEEAALFLKISSATLRNLTSNGKIPFYKFGRRNRYRLKELHSLLLGKAKGAHHGN